MPDWIAHLLVAWSAGRLLEVRKSISKSEIVVLMFGAVLPDIVAINYLLSWMGVDPGGLLLPFHTIAGALVVSALVSLLFMKSLRKFYLLAAGVMSHFALDSLLLHAGGGMVLLFPFSWMSGFQFGVVSPDSWIPALCSIFIAAVIFFSTRKLR
ncbi:MAG: metal-dependent hydrolase [Candidatus Hadarchaeales archaeon]